MEIKCKCCGMKPKEIREYVELADQLGVTPEEAVMREEGTYNVNTGKFYCTSCYIKLNMPLGKA